MSRLLTIKDSGPEKTTGPSGVIPIAVLKYESNAISYNNKEIIFKDYL